MPVDTVYIYIYNIVCLFFKLSDHLCDASSPPSPMYASSFTLRNLEKKIFGNLSNAVAVSK